MALNVPVPRPAMLMPFAAPDELTLSNASDAPELPVTLTAGPPVALNVAVPAAGTVTDPALDIENAGAVPLVVVRARSRRPVGPVTSVRLTPPLPDPVTVIESNSLLVKAVPVTSSPAPLVVTMETVPELANTTVPALVSFTPVPWSVVTLRLEMLVVPVVAFNSRPG